MKVKKNTHVGIAVNKIEDGLELYRDFLGLEVTEIKDVPERSLRVAFIPNGDSEIELLEPTSSETPIGKFLAKNGPGLHHLAFTVDNIDAALKEAEEAGFEIIDKTPRPGAHGGRIAFLHPKTFGGVLLELCESCDH